VEDVLGRGGLKIATLILRARPRSGRYFFLADHRTLETGSGGSGSRHKGGKTFVDSIKCWEGYAGAGRARYLPESRTPGRDPADASSSLVTGGWKPAQVFGE